MAETTFSSFAVVGAGGSVGKHIVESLIAKNVNVLVLTRPSSSSAPSGPRAKVERVEYTDIVGVARVLQEHNVEVLISALPFEDLPAQEPLAKAALQAGCVRLFVPSEYGMPTEGGEEAILLHKDRYTKMLKELGMPSLRLYSGLFAEWIPIIGCVAEKGKFLLVAKGDTPMSVTTMSDVGGYLAHIITTLPPSKLLNTVFRIEGDRATLNEFAVLYEKADVSIQHAEKIPEDVKDAFVRDYLQQRSDTGGVSTRWDIVSGREMEGEEGNMNGLWEGHVWTSVRALHAL
ncbi:NAD(P)-binding protein [Coniophora puteana RWD-64-598 SS2]|uniref:NAD(P)-binding protein n=1 Tax=Coniophora puteana (strain RWD-64-598) TaxID=741705 RepID=A0A5M3MFV0_CONPW|nr:NAD(P)-binding protein [Coniophora puteana RWD-64-598 SS2]EIW78092.1 NAD(P)-binding protein [Coniophora puteana RWD-64-598 SS2]